MKKNAWRAVALVLLLFAVTGSVAFAQDGGGGDKFIFGQSYTLAAGETLNGNLAVVGGNVTLERGSMVNGDVAVAGGKLTVAGTVRGSVAVLGSVASLEDTALIEGDFASLGGSVDRAPGATIQGQIMGESTPKDGPLVVPPIPIRPFSEWRPGAFGGLGQLVSWELGTLGAAILLVLLGLLALVVAPKALGRMASTAAMQPAMSFGVGLLTSVVAILAGTLLLIACCTGLLVWLVLAIALLVGWIAVGLWLGQRLLAALKVRTASSLTEVAVGVFLITFVGRLPWCIGFLFSAILGCIGLGAVVLTRFGTQPATGGGATPPAPSDPTGNIGDVGLLPAASAPVVVIPAGSDASVIPEAVESGGESLGGAPDGESFPGNDRASAPERAPAE